MTIQDVRLRATDAARPAFASEPASGDMALRAIVVAGTAAKHADAVDRESRFPAEAIEAVKSQRLLGLLIPRELGGDGASIGQVAEVCFALGRSCASTAMIFAMHQTKVACILRHSHESTWHRNVLRRIAADQLLLASSTTEGQNGGNVRSSEAAIQPDDTAIALERAATVISYGAQADGVVTTARRAADAAKSDQVLVVFLKEDYRLEPLNGWETLGMRGTCSLGFKLEAKGSSEQILPDRYETIHAHTMTPVAHILWSSAWAGIAAGATERAQAFIRTAARKAGGQMPPGATRYGQAVSSLRTLRALIGAAIERFERAGTDETILGGMEFQTALTNLKVEASELAVETVMTAMRACGLSGYRQDGEFSIGRHLRDILSAPVMIHNDRITGNGQMAALMAPVPGGLRS